MLIDEAELGAQQIGGRAFVVLEHLVDGVEGGLGDLAHHGYEEMFLVLEIDVDRALGDAGALGDLIERGHGVAVAREFGERGFQNFLRPLGLAPPPGFGPRFQVSLIAAARREYGKCQVID